MSKPLHKIDPQHLQPGMFIEELDRPWLETPLKFQGFYVRNIGELRWIKDNCRYVLVDSGKSDAGLRFDFPDRVDRRPHGSDSALLRECLEQMMLPGHAPSVTMPVHQANGAGSPSIQQQVNALKSTASWAGRPRPPQPAQVLQVSEVPDERRQMQMQVVRAESTYREAHRVMSGVLNELRAGGELDVSAVERVIYPVIDCVLQSTDAMAFVLRLKATDDYIYNHAGSADKEKVVWENSSHG